MNDPGRVAPYECKICGASFVTGWLLNGHIEQVHYPQSISKLPVIDGIPVVGNSEMIALEQRLTELEAKVAELIRENELLKAGK